MVVCSKNLHRTGWYVFSILYNGCILRTSLTLGVAIHNSGVVFAK